MSGDYGAATRVILMGLALHMWSISHAQEAEIIIPPRPVNVSVNGVASFSSTAIARSFVWDANGAQIDNTEKISQTTVVLDKDAGLRRSNLSILISSTENASNITCTAISFDSNTVTNNSVSVLLLVQGILEPVNNLTVSQINSTTVLISWSPPFTLEGVPILGYNVTINTTNGKSEQIYTNGSTLLYQPVQGATYITVVAINQAGPGQLASLSKNIPTHNTSTGIADQSLFSMASQQTFSTVQSGSSMMTVQQETSSKQMFGTLTPIASNTPMNSSLNTHVILAITLSVVEIIVIVVILVSAAATAVIFKKKQGILVITTGNRTMETST